MNGMFVDDGVQHPACRINLGHFGSSTNPGEDPINNDLRTGGEGFRRWATGFSDGRSGSAYSYLSGLIIKSHRGRQ